MIYNMKKLIEVKYLLYLHGIKAIPWGSIAKTGKSVNDMDLIITNCLIDGEFIDLIRKIFYVKKLMVTNWGGVYIKTTHYGDIDLFPKSYLNSRCKKCKKRCGW